MISNRLISNYLIITAIAAISFASCKRKVNVGSYKLNEVINAKHVLEYKTSFISLHSKKTLKKVDSLRFLLSCYRDSIKKNILNKEIGFQKYNTLKQELLSKEKQYDEIKSDIAFRAQDSIYKKLSLVIKNIGKSNGLDLILPQNEYSLNYIKASQDITHQINSTLKSTLE